MKSNKNSKKSAYNSNLEKYMDKQEDRDNLNLDEDSNFKRTTGKSSRLDEYLGVDEKQDDEDEIKYCSTCGKELKKFNYGDKCDDCVKKIALGHEINNLLDYVNPSEELKKDILLRAGFDELKLNILVSNLLNERLIFFGENNIFLADVKKLNRFFKKYGLDNDILDESRYKKPILSDEFVDIEKYSQFVKIFFNSRSNKWELSLLRDGNFVIKKSFVSLLDANNHATRYLNDIGELGKIQDKITEPQNVKYKRSKHKFIFFSTKRNQWFVKVRGYVGSKIVGFYDSEEEAVIARDEYIQKKRENQAKLRPNKFKKNESDAIISFHERSNQWVVKVKIKKGGFKKLGYFDTEEEAIAAKNEYYGIDVGNDEFVLMFGEGDKVKVIEGDFEFEIGIVKGFFEERDSFIVKLENPNVPRPLLFKENQLKLI